ncbi:MAG: IspD/TarI family cytidylyltransferase [Alphaproteobacteria bacterium]
MSTNLPTHQDQPIKPALLIVAAGSGTRMGAKVPKQYLKLDGISLLRRSIESWKCVPNLLIQVVISKSAIDLYEQATSGTDVEMLPPVFGGTDRQSSVLNGLKSLNKHEPTHVLIHDAARPCMPSKVYDDVLTAAVSDGASLAVLPQIDSLHLTEGGYIKQAVNRASYVRAQTPQGFEFQSILKAHHQYANESYSDDVAIAMAFGMKVKLVDGDENGMKVTSHNDLITLENRKEQMTHV